MDGAAIRGCVPQRQIFPDITRLKSSSPGLGFVSRITSFFDSL
jgi:hypothetical protein